MHLTKKTVQDPHVEYNWIINDKDNHVVFVCLEDFYFELEENKFLACFSLDALFYFMLISAIL
jgi:hypothetical protein